MNEMPNKFYNPIKKTKIIFKATKICSIPVVSRKTDGWMDGWMEGRKE
jgi:hypothetical protein